MCADEQPAQVTRIAGPVVGCTGLTEVRLHDVVRVGSSGLIGEVIRLNKAGATLQVYEDTIGLRVGEPVFNTGLPLTAKLGPGLLGQVFDGLQRPLSSTTTPYLVGGITLAPLSLDRRWRFSPLVATGTAVQPGDRLGYVPETRHLNHYLLVPPACGGVVTSIVEGPVDLTTNVATIETAEGTEEVTLLQEWPVRQPRPVRRRLNPKEPLISGMRIIDTFFPVARGGTAIIPGGFGTGKTVAEQSLARWTDVDIVVYVGCGERGNEMAEVLHEFPELEDPRYGAPLIERTILVANTSNMPVAARVTSVYTGLTMAEYYRDMGYDVLLLADSTSRWAEALREISSRLEEMPGEEGYPAYLGARLAGFYERAGRVETAPMPKVSEVATGSVTIIGTVSPQGGDFSEPVTQNSLRVAGTFWAMDRDLAQRRHFPAINWLQSYSLYDMADWFEEKVGPTWTVMIHRALELLQEEARILEIVQLIGPDALAEEQRLLLAVARILREDFLQQHAFHPIDRYCPLSKSVAMLGVILTFEEQARAALARGVGLAEILNLSEVEAIARMKEVALAEASGDLAQLAAAVASRIADLSASGGANIL